MRTPRLECTFTLQNDSTKPLTITRLRGSCGCETLLLQKDGRRLPAASLNPGEKVTLRLSIQLHTGSAGPARKYVWVDGPETTGLTTPLATLEVDLTLRRSVFFTPSFVNFGKVEAGAGAAQTLTVSLDSDLSPDLPLPLLQSTDPSIHVQAVGPLKPVQAGEQSLRRQTYQVLLSPSAHAGRVSGSLVFPAASGALPSSASPLAGLSISVVGTVSGALDALPATLFFGSLPAGKPASRSVILSVASAPTAQSLHAAADTPWLTATLAPCDPTTKHRLLTVTLTTDAPLGPLQGKISITSAAGDHLDIPVIAELTK